VTIFQWLTFWHLLQYCFSSLKHTDFRMRNASATTFELICLPQKYGHTLSLQIIRKKYLSFPPQQGGCRITPGGLAKSRTGYAALWTINCGQWHGGTAAITPTAISLRCLLDAVRMSCFLLSKQVLPIRIVILDIQQINYFALRLI